MKRLNTNVGAANTALQETPEVFNTVSVNRAVNVVLRMLYECVLKAFAAKRMIGTMLIGINSRARLYNFTNDFFCLVFPGLRNDASADLAFTFFFVPFKQSKYGC